MAVRSLSKNTKSDTARRSRVSVYRGRHPSDTALRLFCSGSNDGNGINRHVEDCETCLPKVMAILRDQWRS